MNNDKSTEPTGDASPFDRDGDPNVFSSIDVHAPPEEAMRTPSAEPETPRQGSPPTPEPTLGDIAPMARLDMRRPHGETASANVRPPRCIIGRGAADLVLEDEFISPWHAQLVLVEETLVLEDMNSYNGVFLGIADQLTLEDEDEIVVGQQRFVFRNTWKAASTADRADRRVRRLGAPASDAPARLLRIVEGGRIAAIHPIDNHLTIGREGCDVTLPEDVALSKAHTEVVRGGDEFVLRDLDSDYGTFIRIHDPVELVDGDCFVLGRTRIELAYT